MTGLATILGATGFIGRRLQTRLTAEGWDVFAPAKGDTSLFGRDMGVVFYCAGLTGDYDRRPFDAVEAHASLVSDLARAGRFERLIYLSSTRLYEGQAAQLADETLPLRLDTAEPHRTFDLSKALGENITLTRADGRGVVARLATVFDWEPEAPGFLSHWLIEAARSRDLTLESSPHVTRDYVHLDDVVTALIALAVTPVTGVVNVASGELVAHGQIANLLLQAGWRVGFRSDLSPPSPLRIDIAKLRGLGVSPRSTLEVVRGYLAGLIA